MLDARPTIPTTSQECDGHGSHVSIPDTRAFRPVTAVQIGNMGRPLYLCYVCAGNLAALLTRQLQMHDHLAELARGHRI